MQLLRWRQWPHTVQCVWDPLQSIRQERKDELTTIPPTDLAPSAFQNLLSQAAGDEGLLPFAAKIRSLSRQYRAPQQRHFVRHPECPFPVHLQLRRLWLLATLAPDHTANCRLHHTVFRRSHHPGNHHWHHVRLEGYGK